jgi:hypothetical protein
LHVTGEHRDDDALGRLSDQFMQSRPYLTLRASSLGNVDIGAVTKQQPNTTLANGP